MLRRDLCRKIADELENLSRQVAFAGEELVQDTHVLVGHLKLLQGFDHTIQVLDGLTDVLRSDDIDDALLHCIPGDLATRLQR